MSKCSWWRGGHDWVIVAEGVENRRWIKTYEGIKLPGTEYTRYQKTFIEKCSKCQKLRAFDQELPSFDSCINREVSIEFAKKKIISLNGFIEDGI